MSSFQAARLIAGNAPPALSLQEAYVAIVHTKNVGQLIKCLTHDLPLGPLQHLKRVRKSAGGQNLAEVLLCLTDQQHQQQQQQQAQPDAADGVGTAGAHSGDASHQRQQQQQLQSLPPQTAQLLQELAAEITTCAVPVTQPASRDAWQAWCEVWPMPWRKVAEDIQLDGQPPSDTDQQYFEQCMAKALAAAAAAGARNAALVVDPSSCSVVAEAVDCSSQHPLDHPAMVAVEAVAARDRRLWPYNGFAHLGRHQDSPDAAGYTAVAPAHPSAAASSRGDGGSVSREDNCRPCKKQKPGDSNALAQQQAADVAATDAAAAAASGGAGSSGSSTDWANKPYLCTGFDCFLVHEPCTMCAMALVHSRLSRVVYCMPNAAYGALGGSYRLHAQRSLNHHYKVYHLPLHDQAAAGNPQHSTDNHLTVVLAV